MHDPYDRPDPLLTGRMRLPLYASDVCILFAVVVVAVTVRRGWAWGPFIAGPVVIAIAAGCNELTFRIAMTVLRPDDDQLRRARAHRRKRNVVIILPGFITMGIAVGIIAGAWESYLPDVLLAAMVVVIALVLPLALLPHLKRRAERLRPPNGSS